MDTKTFAHFTTMTHTQLQSTKGGTIRKVEGFGGYYFVPSFHQDHYGGALSELNRKNKKP